MCMSSSCQDSAEQSTEPSSTRRLMNRKTQGSYWGLSQRFPGRSRKLQNSGSCNEKGTEIDLGNHEYEFSCRLPSNCRVEYSRSNLTYNDNLWVSWAGSHSKHITGLSMHEGRGRPIFQFLTFPGHQVWGYLKGGQRCPVLSRDCNKWGLEEVTAQTTFRGCQDPSQTHPPYPISAHQPGFPLPASACPHQSASSGFQRPVCPPWK